MIDPCSPSETTIGTNECRTDSAAPAASESAWQQRFLEMLPKIRRHAHIRFRAQAPESREELVQETVARALLDYLRLVERGKDHVASATPLARFAVAQVRQGRRVGQSLNSRDVGSEYCQSRHGIIVNSLHGRDDLGDWRETLVEDKHSTPAQLAAMRCDFAAWLSSLPCRSRRLAERLAMGETTSGAASLFGISRGRVSQLRRELCRAWYAFQGESVPAGR
jgi:DNA-directed RNA polymerase specialized sigma24 family protein